MPVCVDVAPNHGFCTKNVCALLAGLVPSEGSGTDMVWVLRL